MCAYVRVIYGEPNGEKSLVEDLPADEFIP